MQKFFLPAIAAVLLSASAHAVDDADKARIQLLEDQMVQLTSDIRKLRADIAQTHDQLAEIKFMLEKALENAEARQAGVADPECVEKLKMLNDRHDQLLALGFKESHPDVANISGLIAKVKLQCAANPQ